MSDVQRFWGYTAKGSECWEWTGGMGHGYGKFWADGKTIRAHRFSWELHNGPVPHGMCVLHRCDNRKCVRPEHLFVGTQAMNMADKAIKGRCADRRGKKHPLAKLSDEDVAMIFLLRRQGKRQSEIAGRFGVGQDHVSRILSGRAWSHIRIGEAL